MTTLRAFFLQIRKLFSNFQKRAEETSTPSHPSYAPVFPEELKRSKVVPLYKKLDPIKKENYRSVSLLPHVSKVFERIIYKQINTYMEDKLSKYLTGFRKSHGTQHLLVTILEKWKKQLIKKNMFLPYF